MGISVQLPVLQNWSCHNCGGCCREHLIEISEAEKRRIDKQGWSQADGIAMDRPLIQKLGKDSFRLAHQADGACVFLDDHGLCRIHAKFGEPAKPLACRVYPYAYHPAGHEKVSVSLRFSCPSVVQNLGASVAEQRGDLTSLGREIVSGKKRNINPPLIHRRTEHGDQAVEWDDFHRFLKVLDDAVTDDSVDLVVRLMRILSWLELVEQSQFKTIRGSKLEEYLALITSAAVTAQPDNDLPILRPGLLARMMFRQLVAQYARHDTEQHVQAGLRHRWGLLTAGVKFATGFGTVPELPESASVAKAFERPHDAHADAEVRFSDLERPFLGRRTEIDEVLTRYFRVKIQGIHFCGPAHYESTLVDGFRSLAMMYPVVLWLARWRATGVNREQLELADVQAGLATADHNFGYSPALGLSSSLNRLVQLSRMHQITRLVGWYSQ